ncbi:MAG: hypothetical protein NT045_06205, partial [Candidatus Aureabacteria bacterium]|nr:hypothetical protein [Candidatus Auribacterota bacterium]
MKKYLVPALFVVCIAGNAFAGGIELYKDAVSVSASDEEEAVTITGPPGCIVGLPPIYIMARNKDTGVAANTTALPDGSFSVSIPAGGRDSVKLTFVSANGKKKEMTVKIRESAQSRAEKAHESKGSEVNVDLGQFSA